MQKLIIVRDKWYRGNSYNSSLLRADGKMCCLGFYAKKCGYAEEEIFTKTSPHDLAYHGQTIKEGLEKLLDTRNSNNEICDQLIDINDSHITSEQVREQIVSDLFKQIDVEVEFV